MKSLSGIPYGSLLSREFHLLFFIICIVLCYSWRKNQISSLLHAIQQSWVDRRELEYISVPDFFIPCSLCCFGRHLKSLHLFRLLSEIKVWQNCRDTWLFSLSFILQKHLSVIFYYTIKVNRGFILVCVWKGNYPPVQMSREQESDSISVKLPKHLVRVLE